MLNWYIVKFNIRQQSDAMKGYIWGGRQEPRLNRLRDTMKSIHRRHRGRIWIGQIVRSLRRNGS